MEVVEQNIENNEQYDVESEANDKSSASNPAENESEEPQEETKRTRLLRAALSKVVQKYLSSSRLSLFAKAYKPVFKNNPKELKSIVEQLNHFMEKDLTSEINKMFDEENLPDILREFDKIIAETPDPPKKKWRPSGDPEKDLAAHIVPEYENHASKLEKILSDIVEENKQLTSAVLQRRKCLLDTVKHIQVIKDEMTLVSNTIDLEN
ncbi:polyamine-modulated factor 1-like [Lineus longissimus]|uniref:polyamine-modulated factor 1-like n=1 Tax=Lineus longissimus TaxID=88925 RepID=UPI002B4C6FA4